MIVKKFVVGDMGNNNYLLIDGNEAALVDCTGDIPELEAFVKENNAELKYILLTHAHFDHIGGVKKLREKTGAKVYLHTEDKEILDMTNEFMNMVGLPEIDVPEIDVYINDGDKIQLGESVLEVIHLPGHTPGGVGYCVNNMVFSGDTIFLSSVGRTDLPGGNFNILKESIKNRLFNLDGSTIIYTGHGAETSVDYEKKYNSFI
ncbi:MAG: MBL fold metallo-hydrolase [Candidatus Gastranaerophilales bacterium]|nr:MBL fold metallo-hydrolase [Candidatus Gastranaerophilales bacterium]